jgi:hypothetical protein
VTDSGEKLGQRRNNKMKYLVNGGTSANFVDNHIRIDDLQVLQQPI